MATALLRTYDARREVGKGGSVEGTRGLSGPAVTASVVTGRALDRLDLQPQAIYGHHPDLVAGFQGRGPVRAGTPDRFAHRHRAIGGEALNLPAHETREDLVCRFVPAKKHACQHSFPV